jgi:Domain of unknown function (DU1801)
VGAELTAASPKTTPTGAAVEAFLEAIPHDGRRSDARALCTLLSDVTGEPPVLWGSSIVGFGAYRYRYESGHEGVAPLASFSPRKANLVVYLIGGYEDRHHKLVERLGPHKTGRSCLYLKRLGDVDLDVLRRLIVRSIDVHRGVDRAARSPDSPGEPR